MNLCDNLLNIANVFNIRIIIHTFAISNCGYRCSEIFHNYYIQQGFILEICRSITLINIFLFIEDFD